MEKLHFINPETALILVLLSSLLFATIGILYSRKYRGYSNYLTAGRKTGTLSLTSSLVSSALGAWILFGPASAATWGGIGSVIGYSLGTAFPMIALIYLGKKIRKTFPSGITFTQFIFYKIGKNLFKFIILLSVFYMFIFLCAEVTAVATLINYISSAPLWITAALVITTTLIYTLYGGLRASIITDNFQFLIIIILLLVCMNNIFSSSDITHDESMIDEISGIEDPVKLKPKHINYIKKKFLAFLSESNHDELKKCISKDLYPDESICSVKLAQQMATILGVIFKVIGIRFKQNSLSEPENQPLLREMINIFGDLIPRVFNKFIILSESVEKSNCGGVTDGTLNLRMLYNKLFKKSKNVVNFDLGIMDMINDATPQQFDRSTILMVLGIAFLKFF